MSTVYVIVTEAEQLAGGLASPEIAYPNADARVDADGVLLVHQQYTVLAEYPTGRYVSWTVEEEAP